MNKTIHQGRNVKRFREMLGLKQEGLAWELGEEWSQKRVSILEQKEVIEQDILEEVAKVLKVPAEAIKNFDADNAINIISETINNHDQSALIQHNPIFNFNPIDKWVEALDENKKLYERLLQAEREKVELLQRMVDRN
ncbi:helix-turn-helix transcriptional regulator [Ravibacter arvi]